MKGRRPRPEELDLWSEVARSTRRLRRDGPFPPPQERPRAAPQMPGAAPADGQPDAAAAEPGLAPFRIGSRARSGPGSTALPAAAGTRPPRMDAHVFARLKRGKMKPEARIDLHGMTLAEAHPALTSFILRSQSRGLRLVLVITGKGSAGAEEDAAFRARGVLRGQVPHWLRLPPLASAVLDTAPAHIRHGGQGALYVYLRRFR
jgi:DNA-nicking Smr family endonuclease